jgi:GAF domain-containing protein
VESVGVPVVGVLAQVRGALSRTDTFIDLSDVIGVEALDVFGATSATLQLFDRQARRYRTVSNAGSLARGEDRHPVDEAYDFDAYPFSTSALLRGRPYRASTLDPACPSEYRQMLERADRVSCLGAPVIVHGRVAAELWLARDSAVEFDELDERLACAVGVLVGRRIEEIPGARLSA